MRALWVMLLVCVLPSAVWAQVPPVSTTVPYGPYLFAHTFSGSDWGQKLTNAIAACPDGTPCTIDLRALPGGTAANDININRSDIDIWFGVGTYTLASGKEIKVNLLLPGTIANVTLRGVNRETSILSCLTPAVACIDHRGLFAASSNGQQQFVVGNDINSGNTTFTADAADIADPGLAAGDVIKVSDWAINSQNLGPDHQRTNDRTVMSVVGTTVTVNQPFDFDFNRQGRTAWERYYGGAVGTYIHDLTVTATAGKRVLYGQVIRDLTIERVKFSGSTTSGSGKVMVLYDGSNVILRDSTIEFAGTPSSVLPLEYSQIDRGTIQNNIFTCGAATGPRPGFGLSVDYGANHILIDNNRIGCLTGQTAGIFVEEADDNIISNNVISGTATTGTAAGIFVNANNIVIQGNTVKNFLNGVGLYVSAKNPFAVTPAWAPSHVYGASQCVLEVPDNGWNFCTSAGGTSGTTQPVWNEVQSVRYGIPATGATTIDGTVIWIGMKYHTTNDVLLSNHQNYNVTNGVQLYAGVINATVDAIGGNTAGGTAITIPGGTAGSSVGHLTSSRDSTNRRQLNGATIQNGLLTNTGGVILASLVNPSGLAISQVPNACSTCATSFSYYVTALTASSGTESARTNITLANKDALDANHKNRVTWTPVAGAACYNVYGRTSGTELLLSPCQTATLFSDDGSLTPAGASAPTVNGTGRLTATAAGTLNTPTDAPVPCAAGLRGLTYFDLSLNELCFCNATNWCKVSAPATCLNSTSCG
jgi:hypothetical protein